MSWIRCPIWHSKQNGGVSPAYLFDKKGYNIYYEGTLRPVHPESDLMKVIHAIDCQLEEPSLGIPKNAVITNLYLSEEDLRRGLDPHFAYGIDYATQEKQARVVDVSIYSKLESYGIF